MAKGLGATVTAVQEAQSAAFWATATSWTRLGHLGVLRCCGGRQQEQGQGVAQPVLVVVGAPSSMSGEFGICVGIGERAVGGGGVCGAHPFAEGPAVKQHGNVGGLVPVPASTLSGDKFD